LQVVCAELEAWGVQRLKNLAECSNSDSPA
jgi:hypothetical protein